MQDVVKVFDIVRKEIRAHLVLIGDGPERSAVELLVRQLDLQNQVCFLGKQDSFVEVLQHSDLFLLPSESESFGLAALEAMACGVPVIATDIHGLPEVVSHEETGLLSAVGDIDSMAKDCLKLLKDPKLQQRFSVNARRRAAEDFNEATVIDQYEKYYRTVLG